MKDLKAARGGDRLRRMIAEGEHIHQDFKFAISDARKIARSISAFANCEGGCLLIGVKDNGVIAGVRNEEDIYVVEQAASLYCRPEAQVSFNAYKAEGGLRVIEARIQACDMRPVYASEADGRWRAYYRVADENIVAHPLMVEAWLNRRNGSAHNILPQHTAALAAMQKLGQISDERALALAMHVSIATAREALQALACADLLDFVFDGSAFKIAAKTTL